MADVFISYAAEDRERVEPIVNSIREAGYSVWWDRRIGIGRSFDREIERELDSCACVVVFWSNTSIEKDWVRIEAQEALDRNILVPVVIDEVKQPLAFRRVQAAQFCSTGDQEFKRLLQAIATATADKAENGDHTDTERAQKRAGDAPLSAIAVLPFDDLTPAGTHRWLTEGLAEDLIDSLNRIEGLRVPGRNSTSTLKEQKAEAEEIGDRLSVGSLITGSLRQSGDQVFVSAQWIRIEDLTPIWSGRYERPFEDIPKVQLEIASGIAEAIRKELGIHDTAEFVSRHRYQTSNMRAWEAFRKGFDLVFPIKSSNAMAEGRQYLEQALEMDPEYLEARAWLAWSKIDRPEERVEESRRVLQQQRTNPVALYSLIEDSQSQWDFETAQLLWRYTVAKNPSDDQLTFVGFYLCACLGALEEALLVTRRGVRMDPLWPARHFFLGLAYLNLGDPDTAIEQIRRAIALGTRFHDNPSRTYHTLAVASQLAGREAEAIDALLAGFPRFRSEIADGAGTDGWHGANLSLLDALGDVPEDHPNRLRRVRFKATVLASIGEEKEMYSQLKELMDKTAEHTARDRETLRNIQFMAMCLRASAEFRRYWREPEFVTLRRQLDDRIARSAGVTGHADLIR